MVCRFLVENEYKKIKMRELNFRTVEEVRQPQPSRYAKALNNEAKFCEIMPILVF